MPDPWPKHERLAEFYRRVGAEQACADFDAAVRLLSGTLNAVEDEHSGVSYDPDNWQTDGRLYPAMADRVRAVSGHPRVRCLHHVRHRTYVSDGGAIEIRDLLTSEVVLRKAGADGKGVWDD